MTDLVTEAERRQQSYMRREGELEQQAKVLQGELDLARGVRPQGSTGVVPPVDAIKSLHGQVRGGGGRRGGAVGGVEAGNCLGGGDQHDEISITRTCAI